MASFKKKARKRFRKQVQKLVNKYGVEAVSHVVTEVTATTDTPTREAITTKHAVKRKASTLYSHTPTA